MKSLMTQPMTQTCRMTLSDDSLVSFLDVLGISAGRRLAIGKSQKVLSCYFLPWVTSHKTFSFFCVTVSFSPISAGKCGCIGDTAFFAFCVTNRQMFTKDEVNAGTGVGLVLRFPSVSPCHPKVSPRIHEGGNYSLLATRPSARPAFPTSEGV